MCGYFAARSDAREVTWARRSGGRAFGGARWAVDGRAVGVHDVVHGVRASVTSIEGQGARRAQLRADRPCYATQEAQAPCATQNRGRAGPPPRTAHETENARRLNETFYGESYRFRSVSLI